MDRAVIAQVQAGRHAVDPRPFGLPPATAGSTGQTTALAQVLDALIVREWTRTLTGPFDWAEWPLDRYFFGDAFLASVDERQDDLGDVAWVCAMVASGLAPTCAELELQQADGKPCGCRAAEDGARKHRCLVVSGRCSGFRLDFWRLASPIVKFDAFTVAGTGRASVVTHGPGSAVELHAAGSKGGEVDSHRCE